ncbi:hypothetical protein B0T26DRAFT_749729 [Lasiosphaeria miniovina]|uniref:Uncharacterized protein n=1 Tax=Lasiosphaeria miniovina TaxID=1954250 RepID=A0AA40AUK8_9PEZI|nr:uncharacterized protein B0T26DRAFT_749729 [Lasiosphaeria miniovina]KAK0722311.1 hypothetical protein B0T26DRAFT_749729 [Lasiosphaeria miniovina]
MKFLLLGSALIPAALGLLEGRRGGRYALRAVTDATLDPICLVTLTTTLTPSLITTTTTVKITARIPSSDSKPVASSGSDDPIPSSALPIPPILHVPLFPSSSSSSSTENDISSTSLALPGAVIPATSPRCAATTVTATAARAVSTATLTVTVTATPTVSAGAVSSSLSPSSSPISSTLTTSIRSNPTTISTAPTASGSPCRGGGARGSYVSTSCVGSRLGNCACGVDADGQGFCFENNLCAAENNCTVNSDCNSQPGFRCLVGSCCGTGKCVRSRTGAGTCVNAAGARILFGGGSGGSSSSSLGVAGSNM